MTLMRMIKEGIVKQEEGKEWKNCMSNMGIRVGIGDSKLG